MNEKAPAQVNVSGLVFCGIWEKHYLCGMNYEMEIRRLRRKGILLVYLCLFMLGMIIGLAMALGKVEKHLEQFEPLPKPNYSLNASGSSKETGKNPACQLCQP